jgi:hypothetical protein
VSRSGIQKPSTGKRNDLSNSVYTTNRPTDLELASRRAGEQASERTGNRNDKIEPARQPYALLMTDNKTQGDADES